MASMTMKSRRTERIWQPLEQDSAKKGVETAKQRYLAFLGPLADLQQALKDMVYVDTQIAEVKTNLLLALGSKAFLNGQTLSMDEGVKP